MFKDQCFITYTYLVVTGLVTSDLTSKDQVKNGLLTGMELYNSGLNYSSVIDQYYKIFSYYLKFRICIHFLEIFLKYISQKGFRKGL